MLRHALPGNFQHLVWRSGFLARDFDHVAVQMRNLLGEAEESLTQRDGQARVQVVAAALEVRVRLLLQAMKQVVLPVLLPLVLPPQVVLLVLLLVVLVGLLLLRTLSGRCLALLVRKRPVVLQGDDGSVAKKHES